MIPVSWIHRLGQLSRGRTARAFVRAAGDPEAAQRSRLQHILRANARTTFGREHGFDTLRGPADYAARVPLTTPQEHQRWVDRVMHGEAHALTHERPVYYVQTTGSTGVPKHVPITPSYRVEFQRALHASLWHYHRRFPDAYRRQVLYFVGSAKEGTAPDGCPIGTMSGYTFSSLPSWVQALYAWPAALFRLRDQPTRTWLALQLAVQAGPSLCGTIFPLSLVLLFRALERHADELAYHGERGTLPEHLVLTDEERRFFGSLVQARPDRAAGLRRGAGGSLVSHTFPELRLVACWTGATAGLYVPELRAWLGEEIALRDAVYSAAEGWMNVPMGEEAPGGPVCVTGHYLEFIPEAAYEAGETSTVGVHALQDGARYLVVLTTSGGAYRYVLGDVVEVCGRFERTPCIRFVRKIGAHCNLAGEKLDEAHVNEAVGAALAAMGPRVTWFCLVPYPGDVPGYALHVEPTSAPGDEAAWRADLAHRVDEGLGAAARDYRSARAGGSLGPVRVRLVAPGSTERLRARLTSEGVAVAQQKARHLLDREDALPRELREG